MREKAPEAKIQIETVLRKNNKKRKRIIFVSLAFLISIISLILIIVNFKNNIVFFYSPSELLTLENIPKKIIRVGGLVKDHSIKKDEENVLTFTITDLEKDLQISFKGITPDLFKEGQGVVAKGKFDVKNNIFIASELLAKHDEKYMPPEVKKSLKTKIKN